MSRKNFIITALLINLTICITLCIVVFTDKNSSNSIENTTENVLEEENSKASGDEQEITDKNNSEEKDFSVEEDTSTTEMLESNPESDTTPVTYINYNGITLNNQEGTTVDNQEETTSPPETTIVVNGTMATIIQSCNIRSQADLSSSSRIGTAIVGSSYRIEPTLCSGNWTAIYLEDNSIGYVSASFCQIN